MTRADLDFELMLEERRKKIQEKKGNDSMNLQKMTIEELSLLEFKIAKEIKEREKKEIKKVTEEFLQVWKKMEKMGIILKTEEISSYTGNTGKEVKNLQIEINGKLVEIYN